MLREGRAPRKDAGRRGAYLGLLGFSACAYLAAAAALTYFQRSFLYFPQPASAAAQAEPLRLPVADARVLATVREREGPAAVILFPGNGDAAALQVPVLARAFPASALYVLNYRGYGGSTGQATEAALQADALVLYDQVAARHREVTVIGRSLGSGIAIRVAALRPVSALVLVTPFNSIQQLAQQRLPMFPIGWMLADKYESWRYAPAVRAPTLLLAAARDRVVPRSSTEELYRHFARGIASLLVIPGVDHGSIVDSAGYLDALRRVRDFARCERPSPQCA